MLKITLNIELTLVAPFLTKSTDAGAFGLDAPLARSTGDEFQFPARLIKGCLRQAVEEIAAAAGEDHRARIEEWFGGRSLYEKEVSETSVDPRRGKLFFSDLTTENKGERNSITTKISIDPDRGAVRENHLLVIESPFKPQEEVKFTGKIDYFAENEDEYRQTEKWISKGLSWITNLGALENINFGRVKTVKVEGDFKEIKDSAAPAGEENAPDVFSLILNPESPFCLAKRRTTENLFESEKIIAGSVIKGCVEGTRRLMTGAAGGLTELEENLELIRFTHAFPAKKKDVKKRPVTPPLSLVKIDPAPFYDVAQYREAILLGTPPQAPAFSIDWKDGSDVDAAFGRENPETILSVQTAIENNKAKENDLYAYEKINPKGFEWLGRADLSRITDGALRATVERQLRLVFECNLYGLGKTKTQCRVQMLPAGAVTDVKPSTDEPAGNRYIITLQTPFLLCDPRGLNESSTGDDLFEAYRDTWETLSDGSVRLSHFFAGQSLAGGEYLHRRFQAGRPYNPFLLTDAGSVFVFEITDEPAARNKIAGWRAYGLPLPAWAAELYGGGWETCPFVPENGFGEIAVNLDVHRANNLPEVTFI